MVNFSLFSNGHTLKFYPLQWSINTCRCIWEGCSSLEVDFLPAFSTPSYPGDDAHFFRQHQFNQSMLKVVIYQNTLQLIKYNKITPTDQTENKTNQCNRVKKENTELDVLAMQINIYSYFYFLYFFYLVTAHLAHKNKRWRIFY